MVELEGPVVTEGELTLIGRFPNPYGTDRKAKASAIEKGAWSPDTDDFASVAHEAGVAVPIEMTDTLSLVASILQRKPGVLREPGSLSTINLITHGSSGIVGLSGRIELPRGGGVGVRSSVYFSDQESGSITEDSLDRLEGSTGFSVNGMQKTFEWKDVRARYAPGVTMVVYACNSAATKGGAPRRDFLERIAYVMGLAVVGFIDAMAFCVTTGGRQLRYTVGIGTCTGGTGVRSFRDLLTQGRAASPKRVVEIPKPAKIANP